MCGIAGIFNYKSNANINLNGLNSMRDYMNNRGPDAKGSVIYESDRIGLAHRRLSIIDLQDSANQPMSCHNDRYTIVYNGEIYNYLELKQDLLRKGYIFKTNSDTEVILALYSLKGSDCLQDLRGMFAFAIWDNISRELFLARDHFGIKPLYYYDKGGEFCFASQVKAILQYKKSDDKCTAGNLGFFMWGHVPEPHTLYKNIKALPSGCYMKVSESLGFNITNYFNLAKEISYFEKGNDYKNINDAIKVVENEIKDSISHHFIADVPVGVFLSAGLDSSLILALASNNKNLVNTFTLGFEEYKNSEKDETILAKEIANKFGSQHHTEWLTNDEALAELENIFNSMDQPSIDGINTYFVSKKVSDKGLKVAISGVGGDELFGGYDNFSLIPKINIITKLSLIFNLLPKKFTKKSLNYLCKTKNLPKKYVNILDYGKNFSKAYLLRRGLFMPNQLNNMFDRDWVDAGLKELNIFDRLENSISGIISNKLKITALEMQWYMKNQLLRDTDWAGMVHSLEIRVPFVDIKLFKAIIKLQSLNSLDKKSIFSKLNHLPNNLLNRKKTGFNIPFRKNYLSSQSHKINSDNKEIYNWLHFAATKFGCG